MLQDIIKGVNRAANRLKQLLEQSFCFAEGLFFLFMKKLLTFANQK